MAFHDSVHSQNLRRPTRSAVDVHVLKDGSIILCHLYTLRACRWVDENVPTDPDGLEVRS